MTSRCPHRGLSVQSGRPGNPFQSFMKTKLKLTASQVRRSVRKLMPRPCRAFRSRARLELGRKAWRAKLELE